MSVSYPNRSNSSCIINDFLTFHIVPNNEILILYPTDPANGNSSSSDNNSRDDILLKPSQRATRSVATKANQGSFQMSIEPVVAFHLFEMFGPIDGVNMRGMIIHYVQS